MEIGTGQLTKHAVEIVLIYSVFHMLCLQYKQTITFKNKQVTFNNSLNNYLNMLLRNQLLKNND